MDATSASSAIASIRNEPTPHTIRVHTRDGKISSISVTTKKRWKTRTANILASMDWEAIEPLDIKDNLIGPKIENKDPDASVAGDLEDITLANLTGKGTELMGLLVAMQKLQLKGQEVALIHQERAYSSVLENNAKLLAIISDRLAKMEDHAVKSFETVTALHNRLNMEIHRAGDDDDEAGDDVDSIARSLIAQVAAQKLGINPPPQGNPPPNGAAK